MRPLAFAAPDAYHRTAAGLLLGGAAGGAASSLVPFSVAAALPVACALAGAAVAAGRRRAILPMAIAGAAAGAVPFALPAHEGFALLAGGAAAGFALHVLRQHAAPELARAGVAARWAAIVAGALALLLGVRAAEALAAAGVFAVLLPGVLAPAALGACVAVFVAIGAAAGHLTPDPDPVEKAHAELAGGLPEDLRVLAARVLDAHRASRRMLAQGEDPVFHAVARRLEEAELRTLALLARCRALGDELALRGSSGDPAERLRELARMRDATDDAGARRDFDLAARVVEEERSSLLRIRGDRDRVIARVHAQLAVLERSRSALVGMTSAGAVEAAAEVARVVEPLSDLAAELDAHGAAVSEAVR